MRIQIPVVIETRNNGSDCSFRCRHLRTYGTYYCQLFDKDLGPGTRGPGAGAVIRCRDCVEAEEKVTKLPHPNPPKPRAKPVPRKPPSVWDRVNQEESDATDDD